MQHKDNVRLVILAGDDGLLRTLNQVAVTGVNNTGIYLIEKFNIRWISGRGVSFFRMGDTNRRHTNMLYSMLKDAMPPCKDGCFTQDLATVEVREEEGCRKYTESVNMGGRHIWSLPMHTKPKRNNTVFQNNI